MNAANLLKPALSRGDISAIGATTLDEYREYIESDAALERRFQPVIIEEPDMEETVEIIKGIKSYYEEYHSLTISDEVIEETCRMCDRYISDRFFPDKAIDVLDEAASRVNLANKALVEANSLQKELYRISTTEDVTFIFITHNIQEAITLGTRVIMMGHHGQILIDDENKIQKPVKPSNAGYGEMWDKFSLALEKANAQR